MADDSFNIDSLLSDLNEATSGQADPVTVRFHPRRPQVDNTHNTSNPKAKFTVLPENSKKSSSQPSSPNAVIPDNNSGHNNFNNSAAATAGMPSSPPKPSNAMTLQPVLSPTSDDGSIDQLLELLRTPRDTEARKIFQTENQHTNYNNNDSNATRSSSSDTSRGDSAANNSAALRPGKPSIFSPPGKSSSAVNNNNNNNNSSNSGGSSGSSSTNGGHFLPPAGGSDASLSGRIRSTYNNNNNNNNNNSSNNNIITVNTSAPPSSSGSGANNSIFSQVPAASVSSVSSSSPISLPAAALPGSHVSIKRCIRVVLAGPAYSRGHKASSFNKSACDNLRCLQCNFKVLCFLSKAWSSEVDYMYFRNNMPNEAKISAQLIDKAGMAAYCCQCSWTSAEEEKAVNINASGSDPQWVCAGH